MERVFELRVSRDCVQITDPAESRVILVATGHRFMLGGLVRDILISLLEQVS